MPRVSILMTTFNRNELLRVGLTSISRQNYPDAEILVLNDGTGDMDETLDICNDFGAKHIPTHMSKDSELHWRVPGFALNIGARLSSGEVLILTCAEMWHVNNCIEILASVVDSDHFKMAIPMGRDDREGKYLVNLDSEEVWDEVNPLKTTLPFLMAVWRDHYFAIGGYDEDFIGQSFDDDDFVDRMQQLGCTFQQTDARCVHLFHPRYCYDKRSMGRLQYNKQLYQDRKGVMVRNIDRDWGTI